jgi:hypothetical protein
VESVAEKAGGRVRSEGTREDSLVLGGGFLSYIGCSWDGLVIGYIIPN